MKAKKLININGEQFIALAPTFRIQIPNTQNYYILRNTAQLYNKFVIYSGNRLFIYNDKVETSFTQQFITAFNDFVNFNNSYLQTQYKKLTSNLAHELLEENETKYYKKGTETESTQIGAKTSTHVNDAFSIVDSKAGTDIETHTGTVTDAGTKNETNTINPHTDMETRGVTTDDNTLTFLNESKVTRENAQQIGTIAGTNGNTRTDNTEQTNTYDTSNTKDIGEQTETITENQHTNTLTKQYGIIDSLNNAHAVDETRKEKTNPDFENEIEKAIALTIDDFAERFLNLFLSKYTFICSSINFENTGVEIE